MAGICQLLIDRHMRSEVLHQLVDPGGAGEGGGLQDLVEHSADEGLLVGGALLVAGAVEGRPLADEGQRLLRAQVLWALGVGEPVA